MTDAPLTPREEDEALAAEYVLGVLDIAERQAVEHRIKRDPSLADAVARWERRLSGLNEGFEPAEPPKGGFAAIEARLFPQEAARHRRPGFLRLLAGAAFAALLALAVLVLVPQGSDGQLVAELGTSEAGLIYEVRHDGQRLSARLTSGTGPGAGQAHELWIIAPDAAPVSLGLLGEAALVVEYPAPPVGWMLAVSVEPAGGSPTGAPTGPVILTAEIGA